MHYIVILAIIMTSINLVSSIDAPGYTQDYIDKQNALYAEKLAEFSGQILTAEEAHELNSLRPRVAYRIEHLGDHLTLIMEVQDQAERTIPKINNLVSEVEAQVNGLVEKDWDFSVSEQGEFTVYGDDLTDSEQVQILEMLDNSGLNNTLAGFQSDVNTMFEATDIPDVYSPLGSSSENDVVLSLKEIAAKLSDSDGELNTFAAVELYDYYPDKNSSELSSNSDPRIVSDWV